MSQLKELSASEFFTRIPYNVEEFSDLFRDQIESHEGLLAEAFKHLSTLKSRKSLTLAHNVYSKELLSYWYAQQAKWFSGLTHRQDLTSKEHWINTGDGEIAVTIGDIDGPVDITELKIERKTPTETAKITITLNRETDTLDLEEAWHPVIIESMVLTGQDNDPNLYYKITFSKGLISKVEVKEYVVDPEDQLPSVVKETKLDFSSFVRYGLNRS